MLEQNHVIQAQIYENSSSCSQPVSMQFDMFFFLNWDFAFVVDFVCFCCCCLLACFCFCFCLFVRFIFQTKTKTTKNNKKTHIFVKNRFCVEKNVFLILWVEINFGFAMSSVDWLVLILIFVFCLLLLLLFVVIVVVVCCCLLLLFVVVCCCCLLLFVVVVCCCCLLLLLLFCCCLLIEGNECSLFFCNFVCFCFVFSVFLHKPNKKNTNENKTKNKTKKYQVTNQNKTDGVEDFYERSNHILRKQNAAIVSFFKTKQKTNHGIFWGFCCFCFDHVIQSFQLETVTQMILTQLVTQHNLTSFGKRQYFPTQNWKKNQLPKPMFSEKFPKNSQNKKNTKYYVKNT